MCLLRCTTRHAKLGHAKKKTFQPMQPKHWAEQGEDLGPATNLRVQKHNWERKKATNRCWQEADRSFGRWRKQRPRGNHRALAFAAKLL